MTWGRPAAPWRINWESAKPWPRKLFGKSFPDWIQWIQLWVMISYCSYPMLSSSTPYIGKLYFQHLPALGDQNIESCSCSIAATTRHGGQRWGKVPHFEHPRWLSHLICPCSKNYREVETPASHTQWCSLESWEWPDGKIVKLNSLGPGGLFFTIYGLRWFEYVWVLQNLKVNASRLSTCGWEEHHPHPKPPSWPSRNPRSGHTAASACWPLGASSAALQY